MYCPLCGSEYRPGFTMCSDCQVALVADPPRGASANPSADDAPAGASFALLWSGSDARIHAEICDALDQQKIPSRTLGSDDHLFNLTTRAAYEVYVPADLVNSAQEAVKQIVAMEESSEPSDLDLLEIPAEEDVSDQNEYEDEEDDRRLSSLGPGPGGQRLDPLDASVEVWSGKDVATANMIALSLRENEIPFRRDPDLSDPDIAEPYKALNEPPVITILAFPEHVRRAQSIIREILDAAPPE